MHLGYVLNDSTFPLLEKITDQQALEFSGNKPLLIVGYSKAVELFGTKVSLRSKIINHEKQIYYTLSREESEENYSEQTTKFFKRAIASSIGDVLVTNVINPKCIDFNSLKKKQVFLHETDKLITISTVENIYFFNKEVSSFFNEEVLTTEFLTTLLAESEVWSWDRFKYFGARLKSNLCYKSKEQLNYLLGPYCDVELYMGVLCLNWMKELKQNEYEGVWQDAYEAEHYLSTLPVKIDRKLVLMLSYQSDNILFESLLKQEEGGYVTQQYNGTDKTTGRMYAKGSGYSLQTLTENVRQVIVAEKDCYLVEFDYKYFEYGLLQQMCQIPFKGDPHKNLAIEHFGDVSYRDIAKGINYGVIYGKSIEATAREIIQTNKLKHSEEELIALLKKIRKPFGKLQKKLESDLKENGFVINPFGRHIVPEKQWAVMNNYIQSTAADIVIRKLLKIKKFFEDYDLSNRVVLQKHDSILFNLREIDIEENNIALKLKQILEGSECDLFGKVSCIFGKNWRDLG